LVFAKEFRLLCFDESFGRAIGRREGLLDLGLMLLAVIVTVVGLQAVGLILVIALLIIPATSARFWTDSFTSMTALAGGIGAAGCWIGASISALAPKLPAGSIIVLTLALMFTVSMVCGVKRGAVRRVVRASRLKVRTGRQHLLRAAAESMELSGEDYWTFDNVLQARSWSPRNLRSIHRRAARSGEVVPIGSGRYRFSDSGYEAAEQVLRNHRLWELFLIRHADIAASHVDRDADLVEHVLAGDLVAELEQALERGDETPPSPHPIGNTP
jgi:manganese/zinc/iron transport system permease protein